MASIQGWQSACTADLSLTIRMCLHTRICSRLGFVTEVGMIMDKSNEVITCAD